MKKTHKLIVAAIAIVLVASASVGATVAYFSASGEGDTNKVELGRVAVEVTEEGSLADGSYVADVKNAGSVPAYLRVTVSYDTRTAEIAAANGWEIAANVKNGDIVTATYIYSGAVGAGETVGFISGSMLEGGNVGARNIAIVADAVQTVGFTSAADAYSNF